jgi:tryptophanyl-tRNA synthetase
MTKKRVLSGIRATGRLHIGNYLGMVKGMVSLQENPEYEPLFMVADLHAMTTPFDHKKLKKDIREVVLDYLAAGLDPEKASVFVQSDVPEHLELAYYFSTVVSIARMSHLPTYKEKVKQYPKNNTMALLYYPVLMAADILIYKTDGLPVGDDQLPHLEVTREIARKMNEKYGTDFPEPEQFKTGGQYIPSLTGEGKMSKSVSGSFINLTDDLDTIKKKLAGTPTDSGKGDKIPEEGGVANLLKLVEIFQGEDRRKEYESQYASSGVRYGELKEALAEAIHEELEPIQEKRKKLEKDIEYVDKVIKDGGEKARKIAKKTLEEVKFKMSPN